MPAENLVVCKRSTVGTQKVTMQELIEKQTFSPSGQYAISVKVVEKNIESFFVFNAASGKYYAYNIEKEAQNILLQMGLIYWLDNSTVVVLYSCDVNREFVQIPLVINHEKKTCTSMKASTYAYSPGEETAGLHYRTQRSQVVLIQRKKYVLWMVAIYYRNRVFYAIPYLPHTSEVPKKFFIPSTRSCFGLSSKIANHLQIPYGMAVSAHRFYAVNGMTISPFKLWDSSERVIPGIFARIDFEKALDVYNMPPVHLLESNTIYELMNRHGKTLDVVEVRNPDLSKVREDSFVKKWQTFYVEGNIVYIFYDGKGGDVIVHYGNLLVDDIQTPKAFKSPTQGPLYFSQTPFGVNVYWTKAADKTEERREFFYKTIVIPRNGDRLGLGFLARKALLNNSKFLSDPRTWRMLEM